MGVNTIVFCYRAQAVLAVFLLWGIFLLNGTLKALLLAAWHGKLSDDVPLKNDYTGVFVVDYLLALLVAFFYYATNGSDEGYQLLVFEGYSTLQSAFVWLYVEMARPGQKPGSIERPLIFGILWQCAGAGIALPLYYAHHILWIDSSDILRVRNVDAARALPFSFLLGAIFPAVLGSAPTWNGPDSRTPEVHQKLLAAWQPDPIWVSLIQYVLTKSSAGLRSRGEVHPNAQLWIRTAYLVSAASSALGHIYTMGRIFLSTDEGTNLVRMCLPFPFTGPSGVPDILARGPWLYLQYDILSFDAASLSWAFILLTRMPNGPRISKLALAVLLLAGFVTIGSGATVSLALYVREGMLPEKAKDER
ncbi:Uu.00g105420.m01.CDS01 [Anthostomella pinea]|uniref:Uu.00g105420.m01.CDS01 n=1 Tax=Anthostomella pinea TaxID=933095 RepID=A0AAI8YFP8_9PEZI|nr:Uu.00g105420.m01.CDS01 [Anthostomella pinea]